MSINDTIGTDTREVNIAADTLDLQDSLPVPSLAHQRRVHSANADSITAPHVTAVSTIRIVLPAYNEAESLPPLLDEIAATFQAEDIPYEVIVVDDGSHDDTAYVARQASFDMPLILVEHPENRGLAGALRTGLTTAADRSGRHDIIVTMDADNTHRAGLIPRMVAKIREGHDVVIASRYRSGARVIGVPPSRNFLSFGARCLFKLLFPIPGVREYTCAYRAYRASVIQSAIGTYGDEFISERGFSCMVDVLLKLRRHGLIMGEVPLILRYDQKSGSSKMHVTRTVVDTLKLIVRRRFERGPVTEVNN